MVKWHQILFNLEEKGRSSADSQNYDGLVGGMKQEHRKDPWRGFPV
ncbi:MAG: hypothetical protein ACTSXP_12985 [Promethearchaeota archaeon]